MKTMNFNSLPTADVLEQETLEHTRQALTFAIEHAKEQGKFYCTIGQTAYDACRKELEKKGYYLEYNMPYGFRVHWNADNIKELKERREEARKNRNTQKQKEQTECSQQVKPETQPLQTKHVTLLQKLKMLFGTK